MIQTEQLTIGGRAFARTYSDAGRYVVSDETGVEYTEAYDPAELGRTYHEGDIIPVEPEPDEDYQDSPTELGVNLDD